MNNETLKKAAEILVECGYCEPFKVDMEASCDHIRYVKDNYYGKVDPFADTLEGRRQADAIEDYLFKYRRYWKSGKSLWDESFKTYISNTQHQWRLDRMEWCLEQLSKNKKYTEQDIKDAYVSGFYEGAGDDAWYRDHSNDASELNEDAMVHRTLNEYLEQLMEE